MDNIIYLQTTYEILACFIYHSVTFCHTLLEDFELPITLICGMENMLFGFSGRASKKEQACRSYLSRYGL